MSLIISYIALLCVFAIPLGILMGIILFLKMRNEENLIIKKSLKKKAWWSILGPIILLPLVMLIFAIITFLTK